MITYVPVTDPEQAHALYHLGLLLWKHPFAEVYFPADSAWGKYGPNSAWGKYGPKEFPTMRRRCMFYIQVEE